MTREVVACRGEDDVQKALDAMSQRQLRRILVVDNDNKIVGIIAQADVATCVDQPAKTAEVVRTFRNRMRIKNVLEIPGCAAVFLLLTGIRIAFYPDPDYPMDSSNRSI